MPSGFCGITDLVALLSIAALTVVSSTESFAPLERSGVGILSNKATRPFLDALACAPGRHDRVDKAATGGWAIKRKEDRTALQRDVECYRSTGRIVSDGRDPLPRHARCRARVNEKGWSCSP